MGWLFKEKTLHEYHADSGDYSTTSGKGKDKKTTGRKGGWDFTKERNWKSGDKPEKKEKKGGWLW